LKDYFKASKTNVFLCKLFYFRFYVSHTIDSHKKFYIYGTYYFKDIIRNLRSLTFLSFNEKFSVSFSRIHHETSISWRSQQPSRCIDRSSIKTPIAYMGAGKQRIVGSICRYKTPCALLMEERSVYLINLWDAEYRERVGFQAEFNWDMGVRSRRVASQGRRRFSRRSRETRGKDVLPSTASCGCSRIFNTFFPLPPHTLGSFGLDKVRVVCDRHVSDDPDVGRTDAHDERRIIWVSLCGYAARFNHRSLWAAG